MSFSLFYFYISGFAGTLAPFFGGLFVLLITSATPPPEGAARPWPLPGEGLVLGVFFYWL